MAIMTYKFLKTLAMGLVFMAGVLLSGKTAAQQFTVQTNYFFNELLINPAYAGSHVQLSATAWHRNQWVNFPGAPTTTSASVHTSLMKDKIGVGAFFLNDQIGSYDNNSAYFSYAYKIKFPLGGALSMGLQAGINSVGADYSDLNLSSVDQGQGDDLSFQNFNETRPNFGAGLYYYNDVMHAGISVPFLLNNNLTTDFDELAASVQEARYYYVNGGFTVPVNRLQTLLLSPDLWVRLQEGQPVTAQLTVALTINDQVRVGPVFRTGDSFAGLIELKLSDSFTFGYTYDWTTSGISNFSNNTHQFMLNYRVRVREFGHGNIDCPSIWEH